MQPITKINPEVTLTVVSSEGYSRGDMSSYYSGTYLLQEKDGMFIPVLVRRGGNGAQLECETVREGEGYREEVPYTSLYRFTLQQGFYATSSGFVSYSLPTTRSYKKGINADLLNIIDVTDPEDHRMGRADVLRLLSEMCSIPKKGDKSDSFLLSRRLVVREGKIYSFPSNKTMGSFEGGVLTTPFLSILDRVSELHGDIKCQLQTL